MKILKDNAYIYVPDDVVSKRKEILFEDKGQLRETVYGYLLDEYRTDNLSELLMMYSRKEVEEKLYDYLIKDIEIYLLYDETGKSIAEDYVEEYDAGDSSTSLTDNYELSCIIGPFRVDKINEAASYVEKYATSSIPEEAEEAKKVFYVFTINYVKGELYKIFSDPGIERKMKQQAKSMEDVEADIYKDAFAKIGNFSQERGNLTTFINQFIQKNRHETNLGKLRQNYGKADQKIKGVNNIWKDKDLGIPTLLDLYIETKISIKTLFKALEAGQRANEESLEGLREKAGDKEGYSLTGYSNSSNYSANPERRYAQKEDANSIIQVIKRLKSPYREVFILKNAELIKDSEFLREDAELVALARQTDANAKKELIHQLVGITAEKVDEYYNKAVVMIRRDSEFLTSIGKKGYVDKSRNEDDIATFNSLQTSLTDLESLVEGNSFLQTGYIKKKLKEE